MALSVFWVTDNDGQDPPEFGQEGLAIRGARQAQKSLLENARCTQIGCRLKDTFRTWLVKSGISRFVPRSVRNSFLLAIPELYKHTPVSYESLLDNSGTLDIYDCLDRVAQLKGDIIECGCYRCGTTIIMASYLAKQVSERKIFACDTFGGFDSNELEGERLRGLTKAADSDFTDNSYDYVVRKIHRLGHDKDIVLVRGYFQDTLERMKANRFCIALIDCDLSQSVLYSADKVFPLLVGGGIILFDDYYEKGFKGVKKVVDEFVATHREQIQDHGLLRRLYFLQKIA